MSPDAEQRAKIAKIAADYFQASRKSSELTASVFLVLTEEQRRELMTPRATSDLNLGPGGPGKNPVLEYLAPLLEKKAGKAAAVPQSTRATYMIPTERFTVLNGLVYLVKKGSLDAAQAKSALDFVNEMRKVIARQTELEEQLSKVFRTEQMSLLASKVIPKDEAAVAWLVGKYLEK